MSRRALLPAVLVALGVLQGPAARAEDVAGEGRAFVELSATPEAPTVGQPVDLHLRLGFDAAFFAAHGVSLYRRKMDVPIHVLAPAFENPADARTLEAAGADGSGSPTARFALGDAIVAGRRVEDETRDGRRYSVVEIVRRVSFEQAGRVELAAPEARYAYASSFDEDFFGDRVPRDRRDARVAGASLAIDVRPPPLDGRPAGYVDAVGRFTLGARLEEVAGGERVRLVVEIDGPGNLDVLTPPDVEGVRGVHLLGTLDDHAPTSPRTIAYELSPDGTGAERIPALALAFYDPTPPGGYAVALSEPLALPPAFQRVTRPPSPSPAPDPGEGPGAQDGKGGTWLRWGLGGVVLFALALLAFVRHRRRIGHAAVSKAAGAASDAARTRRRDALEAARRAIGAPGADLVRALSEHLAAGLGCSAPAVIAPDLPTRLLAAGVPPEVAARAGETLLRLVASRYGGGQFEPPAPDLERLLDDLEAAFSRGRTSPRPGQSDA